MHCTGFSENILEAQLRSHCNIPAGALTDGRPSHKSPPQLFNSAACNMYVLLQVQSCGQCSGSTSLGFLGFRTSRAMCVGVGISRLRLSVMLTDSARSSAFQEACGLPFAAAQSQQAPMRMRRQCDDQDTSWMPMQSVRILQVCLVHELVPQPRNPRTLLARNPHDPNPEASNRLGKPPNP